MTKDNPLRLSEEERKSIKALYHEKRLEGLKISNEVSSRYPIAKVRIVPAEAETIREYNIGYGAQLDPTVFPVFKAVYSIGSIEYISTCFYVDSFDDAVENFLDHVEILSIDGK